MLKLTDITKDYETGNSVVHALKGVSLEFRKSEFVSILGQSGCGKTTLLNIIGGLDKYTSGDLVINGVSTKLYKDANWDTYRNHSIGFVFQSYNLIPHQTVLANVELALTLSGVSKAERKARATEALKQVGLEEHLNKKPNQLSGGQMQRVAIARALVNNPDILLADEPTGALDSETSVQIMDILKNISKDKLIIMVTHNPDLASEYSTRIINLLDGLVVSDSDPYDSSLENADSISEVASEANNEGAEAEAKLQGTVDPKAEAKKAKSEAKKNKKKRMSFFTALSLSLNNLLTKKGRTFLTAFAGSIGIIGIALILSVSTGVNGYIDSIEEGAMSSNPLTINETYSDMGSLMNSLLSSEDEKPITDGKITSNDIFVDMIGKVTSSTSTNNLEKFKKYIDSSEKFKSYTNDIKYSYAAKLTTFTELKDADNNITYKKNLNGITELLTQVLPTAGADSIDALSSFINTSVWAELVGDANHIKSQYTLVAGNYPTNKNEIVLIVDSNHQISDISLYSLGLLDINEIKEYFLALIMYNNGYTSTPPDTSTLGSASYTYDELFAYNFKAVTNTELYKTVKDENGNVTGIVEKNDSEIQEVAKGANTIKIVGIVKASESNTGGLNVGASIGYLPGLMTDAIDKSMNSEVLLAQLANEEINLLTGLPFDHQSTYGNVLAELGFVDYDRPRSIRIFPKDFESKEAINNLIDEYNKAQKKEDVINYTDSTAALLDSISTIVDAITYVLIAFVSISLVVSSIMIGIITYISVLERTKEIGVLRSIGASKKDVSRVFNAETLIVGFTAGLIGILVSLVGTVVINAIIYSLTELETLKASLSFGSCVVLIAISMLLTFIAGLVPSRMAAKKDPVIALRTE